MIKKNEFGLWEVTVGGEMIARVSTYQEAVVAHNQRHAELQGEISRIRFEMETGIRLTGRELSTPQTQKASPTPDGT